MGTFSNWAAPKTRQIEFMDAVADVRNSSKFERARKQALELGELEEAIERAAETGYSAYIDIAMGLIKRFHKGR